MAVLTKQQLNELRILLDHRRAQLKEEISAELARSETQRETDLSGPGKDAGDESVATLLGDMTLTSMDRQMQELREIEAAFARMQDGSYGICSECGGDISVARLRVQLTAQRCVVDQAQYEKLYAQQIKPSL